MLHTPTAQEPGITTERLVTKDGQPAKIGERAYDKDTGRLAQVGLSQQVMMILPTPKASDNSTGIGKNEEPYLDGHIWRRPNGVSMRLSAMANRDMLPTPLAGEYRDAAITENNATKGITDNISRVVSRLALGINKDGSSMDGVTPTVQDSKDGQTSRLSPLFTEEMMGFPLMWTALPFLSESGAPKPSKPTATPSSPK